MSAGSLLEVRVSQGRVAGLVTRIASAVIDLVFVMATVLAAYLFVAAISFVVSARRFDWPTIGTSGMGTAVLVFLVVYLTSCWTITGRSVGKQLMGLRVRRVDGTRLGLGAAFARALLCTTLPVGLLWAAFSRHGASFQDVVVKTKVVYDWLPRVPTAG